MVRKKAIIVGAGPAGLLCAYVLSQKGIGVTVFEDGYDVNRRRCPRHELGYCVKCEHCSFIQGVGGGGLFSDGKLNLSPTIGGNLLEFMSRDEAIKLIERVDGIFEKNGAKGGMSDPGKKGDRLEAFAKAEGIEFIPIKQRHIGSDRLPNVIKSIKRHIEKHGGIIITETRVKDVLVKNGCAVGVIADGKKIPADYVVIATGRSGARWNQRICSNHGIKMRHQPLDIGVRVEVPAEIMDEITKISWDPKFHINTKHYDDFVRTFCTNPHGFVISEYYGDYVCVNGHARRDIRSQNTNFALLVHMPLTEPLENTTQYGESIARMATTIGGGMPIIQRLIDIKSGRRSTWERIGKSYVEPTLKHVTPGDIGMALPSRIVMNVLEALEMLNKVIPGVAEDSTLLYAPEIKFHALRVHVTSKMETNVKNLFMVGDGAGVSRGIVHAAATGIIAAEEILSRAK